MNTKNTIIVILRVLLGATFIFSGIAKLDSIFQFEQAIFKAGVSNWDLIPYLSRFTIAFEIFLGFCFFHTEGLKKFTIPATFIMLAIFCIHLGYTILTEGGLTGNCGCFGEKVPMTPLSSLIKNIVTLGILVYLYKAPNEKPVREVFIPLSLGALSFIFVFFFFPVKDYGKFEESANSLPDSSERKTAYSTTTEATPDSSMIKEAEKQKLIAEEAKQKALEAEKLSKQNKKDNKTQVVEPKDEVVKVTEPPKPPRVTSKFAPFKNFSNGATTHLDEGKKIICMYNTGCDHCMENAKKICELSKKTKLPEVYILFWGDEAEVAKFFEFAGCKFPYKILEPQVFFPLIGKDNFPKVHYLHEGNVMGQWAGDDFTPEKLQEALKK